MTTKIIFILCTAIIAVVTAVSIKVYGLQFGIIHAIPSVVMLVAGFISGIVEGRQK